MAARLPTFFLVSSCDTSRISFFLDKLISGAVQSADEFQVASHGIGIRARRLNSSSAFEDFPPPARRGRRFAGEEEGLLEAEGALY